METQTCDETTIMSMRTNAALIVERGSSLFETATMYSDKDVLYIIPDLYNGFTCKCEKGILEHTCTNNGVKIDEQFVCEEKQL